MPLSNAQEVFLESSSVLGQRLARIPDGETGERIQWIMFQYILMAGMQELTVAGDAVSIEELREELALFLNNPDDAHGFDFKQRQLKLRENVMTDSLDFPPLGYADAAIKSYQVFRDLKDEGRIDKDTRFQVSLPTPFAPVAMFLVPKQYAAIRAVYERYKDALLSELEQITLNIPPRDLAVQWDVCIEIVILEKPSSDDVAASWNGPIQAELCALGDAVPEDVQLGYHFCYGDLGHEHFLEPQDTGLMVDLANELAKGIQRPVHWMHMPVPRNRNDAAYFAPLQKLRLQQATTLFLGLVHSTDGVNGALQRISVASTFVQDFGIATECGMGRRAPESIRGLLQIHRQAADAAVAV
jgi:hypothetical protein